MPHSLRSKLKALRYKGIITDKECQRLCNALDLENSIPKIKADIENYEEFILCVSGQKGIHIEEALKIIDKYTKGDG